MSLTASNRDVEDRLYNLLPEIHRTRDMAVGYPLRTLLRAVSTQAAELSADIHRQYENWFIETCQDYLVPYFADLVSLSLGAPAGGEGTGALAEIDASWRRRQVADALSDRRRKGTFSVLEQLAFDATGWPARVLEMSGSTLLTPALKYPGIGLRPLLDTRDGEALEALGTPFAAVARLADVRRLSSARCPGYANPANVAVWLWRLVADTTNQQPAASAGESNHYTFDPLGRDTRLCVAPAARRAGVAPAGMLDVPTLIGRLSLESRLEDYYGPGRSIGVYRGSALVPRSQIIVGDLRAWRHSTPPDHVTIDPVRGRIAFPTRHVPEEGVWVAYSRLTVGGLGGGHYERPISRQSGEPEPYRVAKRGAGFARELGAALAQWAKERQSGKASGKAVIEICDDEVYAEHLHIRLGPGERLQICAAQGCRPIILPLEERTNRPDALRVHGTIEPEQPKRGRREAEEETSMTAPPSETTPPGDTTPVPAPGASRAPELVLSGVWIAGAPVELAGQLGGMIVRHCTLVPETGTVELDAPHDRRDPSLIVAATPCPLSISWSVVGRIRVECEEVGHDPIPVSVMDSILDASDLREEAVEGAGRRRAFVSLSLARTSVLGAARVREVAQVTDSLFVGPLDCERRQVGDVSFCYLPASSRTPQRASCQPDGVLAAVDDRVARGKLAPEDRERERIAEQKRVAPVFDSTHFGAAAYGRLADGAARELTQGAHDEGELGAYHEQWQRLRAQDLRRRLEEFAPAGMDIDIVYAT